MMRFSATAFLIVPTLTALTMSAFAETTKPMPWELLPDMGYVYD